MEAATLDLQVKSDVSKDMKEIFDEDDDYLDDLLEIGRTKTQRVLEDGYLRFSNLKKIFCAFKNSVDCRCLE